MSRKAKKVDEFWHSRRGVKVSIFLNLDTSKFFADVLDQRVEAPTLAELKSAALTVLNAFEAYDWQPVIYIEQTLEGDRGSSTWAGRSAHRYRSMLSFEFWRVEIAKNPASEDNYVERPFLVDGLDDTDLVRLSEHRDDADKEQSLERHARDRKTGRDITTHYKSRANGPVQIPYTEATWQVLQQIRENILQAGKRLEDLVAAADLPKALLELGSQFKLLPPAPAKPKKRSAR